ncbi:hypothetical protein HPP92_019227 [Vanilla planifolia]|uniref:Protein kinase domain-containing protein n=1 Tax=Vanilla planifolia TaxID=51239 RepID=A0A835Q9W6_VANPL|nr:hypothetical protein HPP92_019227 [Vanilla planifolia]
MDISIQDVVRELTSANVIGTGSSGMVYRVGTVAVKKMWSEAEEDDSGAFRNEIEALVAVLFLPNGLELIAQQGREGGGGLGGVHGDVKSMNVLLGSNFEPYLADFGLARILSASGAGDGGRKVQKKDGSPPRIAGSYGYMAPEHASMQEITEKIDVYSYGVVMLEVLIGKHPLDPSIPGGSHLVHWVHDHLRALRDPRELLDPRLRDHPEPQMHEMTQTLAISILCVSHRPDDRPTMKDVVAILKEIRRPVLEELKQKSTCGPTAHPSGGLARPSSSNCSFATSDDSN